MNLDSYYTAKDDLEQFLYEAQREHRELGVSLRIANEERVRNADMLSAAIELLAERTFAGDEQQAVDAILERVRLNADVREVAKVMSA